MRNRVLVPAIALLVLALAACEEDTKLKVTGLEPTSGAFEGGTRVTIKGNRFTKDGQRQVSVWFGSGEAKKKADVLGFQGDSRLVVRAPGGQPNEKADILIVFEPGGEITLKNAFTYVEEKKADVGDLDIKKDEK